MPACRNRIANWLASVTMASSVAFSWVGAAVRGYRSRTAAGLRGVLGANAIDPSVIAITPAEVPCRHTPRRAGNLRAEVMIIATSGAKTPETPARTVIAWFPPPSALRRGADGSVAIVPPSGWAICDGTKGTSDVSDRFIIDGSRNEGIESSAGSATSASVPSAGTWRAGGELASAGHDHGVKTDPSDSIPAFVTLIYIMKL
jgi:hypothetical protein